MCECGESRLCTFHIRVYQPVMCEFINTLDHVPLSRKQYSAVVIVMGD